MSATGKTTNLELPLYIGSDTTSWLTDFNGAMLKIDTAIKEVTTENDGIELIANGASTKADTANTKADANATSIATANSVNDSQNTTLVSHTASINGLQTAMTTATTNIAKNATDIDGIKADIVEIQGDTNLATQVSTNTDNIGTLTTAQNAMSAKVTKLSETIMLTATSPSVGVVTKIASYPEGYTKDNTIVVCAQMVNGAEFWMMEYVDMTFYTGADGLYMTVRNNTLYAKNVRLFISKLI